MCLDLIEGAELQIATEDITVYKRVIEYPDITKLKSGMSFKSVIKNIKCEGKISVEDNRVFFCTDDGRLDGAVCRDKQGYIYCWEFDLWVNLSKTTIDSNPIPIGYITPYYNMPIKIGKTYHSELCRDGNRVNEGLHSFETAEAAAYNAGDVVECIIPKGSQYYIGTFRWDLCYASDCIKYVKLI